MPKIKLYDVLDFVANIIFVALIALGVASMLPA